MQIRFLLWAQLRVAAGQSKIEMELPEGTRLAAALEKLYTDYPKLAALSSTARAAVGNEYATGESTLRDGDEVSLIPPVQGG